MVTFNGRITLPPHVRKQLGLRTGDSVEFVEIGNGRFAIAHDPRTNEESDPGPISDREDWESKREFRLTAENRHFRELDEVAR
jgi:AbrB family looped-hinge helix DNA binding protein